MDLESLIEQILLEEKKIGSITSFEQLPERRPYGFCVYYDGSMDVVGGIYDHEAILLKRGFESYEDYIQKGCVRMSYDSSRDVYYLLANLRDTKSRVARVVAKDLARWYNTPFELEEGEDYFA